MYPFPYFRVHITHNVYPKSPNRVHIICISATPTHKQAPQMLNQQ